ncbi:MAG: pyridoxal phosphate-dependent decarboxylase family protein, partial [Pirellulaceae bacterium]
MTPRIPDWFDAERFREHGQRVIDDLATFLENSTTGNADQVLPWRDENALYESWKDVLERDIELRQLFREVADASIRLHHPRYLGHQISPSATASALAGFVADTLNNGMGVYEMGMAGTVLERIIIDMLARQFGFPSSASGFLTSGGSLGNLTALLAARNTADPEVLETGNRDQRYAVMISQQAHYCIQRAAGIMGWGRQGIISVPVDEHFSMRVDLLPQLFDQATQSGQRVVSVVGSACSTATGAYDDLAAIGQFCEQRDLWFHVDGAHGAAATFSPKYRHLLDGIEHANSVTLDFHKMLLVPALATALVFRDGRESYRSFAQKADYLFDEHEPE